MSKWLQVPPSSSCLQVPPSSRCPGSRCASASKFQVSRYLQVPGALRFQVSRCLQVPGVQISPCVQVLPVDSRFQISRCLHVFRCTMFQVPPGGRCLQAPSVQVPPGSGCLRSRCQMLPSSRSFLVLGASRFLQILGV